MQLNYLSLQNRGSTAKAVRTYFSTFILAATVFITFILGLVTMPQIWGPYMGYTFDPVAGTVLAVELNSPAQRAQIQVGDVLTHIDGVPLGQARPLYQNFEIGRAVLYTFTRDGSVKEIEAIWAPPHANELTRRLMNFTLSVTFWLLGLVVFLNRRNRTVARSYLMVCAWGASALWLIPLTNVGIEWSTQLMYIAHLLAGTSFLHFHLLFPVIRHSKGWRLLLRGSYLVALTLTLFALVAPPSKLDAWSSWEGFRASIAFGTGISIYFTVTVMLGLFALLLAFRQGSGNARRKVRLIVFGTLIGMAPLLTYYALRNVYPIPYEVATVALVLIPIVYTISISHFDLMAVDYVLYRILVVLILALSVMATYLGIVTLINLYDPRLAQHPLTGAFICMVISWRFSPLQTAVKMSLGWIFYGRRRIHSSILSESVQLLTDQLNMDSLVHVLTSLIPTAMGVSQTAVMTLTKDAEHLHWIGGQLTPQRSSLIIPLDVLDPETLNRLRDGKLVPQDLHTDSQLFDGSVRWWVPLQLANELQGVWVIGPRIRDESFGPDAIALLQEAAVHGAFVIKVLETVEQLRHQRVRAESSAQELFEAYSMLFKAQDEERGRFSRDLHDEVLQQLYGLDLTIQRLRTGVGLELNSQLERLQDQIGNIARSARSVCYGLRPADLQKLGLPGALRRLTRDIEERADTQVSVEINPPHARFQEELEVTLYYIAQEALNNIVKHSDAARAEVRLTVTPTGIVLFIQDDGVGFNQAQVEGKRLGLVGMKQRVSAFGGTLDIESALGSGTAISVEIPLIQKAIAA